MATVRLTRRAFADLRRLRNWLADKNPGAAEEAANAILAGIDRLADFPLMGVKQEPSISRELGISFGRDGYVARYWVQGERVYVTRIFHGRERR